MLCKSLKTTFFAIVLGSTTLTSNAFNQTNTLNMNTRCFTGGPISVKSTCNIQGSANLTNAKVEGATTISGCFRAVDSSFNNIFIDASTYDKENEAVQELLRSIDNGGQVVFKNSSVNGDIVLIGATKILLIDSQVKNIFIKSKKAEESKEETKDVAVPPVIEIKGDRSEVDGDIVFEKDAHGVVLLPEGIEFKGTVVDGKVELIKDPTMTKSKMKKLKAVKKKLKKKNKKKN